MTIVLGYDDSEPAQEALTVALDLAGRLGEPLVVVFGVAPPGRLGEEFREHEAAIEDFARPLMAQAQARADAAGVQADTRLVPLRPVPALLSVAEEQQARMIVVGSHGEGGFRAALVGSTTYKLLHQAEVPVLVVPVPESDA
jgi:nucleotide-binding universal stress UspA family protein